MTHATTMLRAGLGVAAAAAVLLAGAPVAAAQPADDWAGEVAAAARGGGLGGDGDATAGLRLGPPNEEPCRPACFG